jgi:hypothetical protein
MSFTMLLSPMAAVLKVLPASGLCIARTFMPHMCVIWMATN